MENALVLNMVRSQNAGVANLLFYLDMFLLPGYFYEVSFFLKRNWVYCLKVA